jgi:hypothetical protein
MTCKHCFQPIERNTVRHSTEPNQHIQHKHVFGHLVSCFDTNGKPTGTVAEPKDAA